LLLIACFVCPIYRFFLHSNLARFSTVCCQSSHVECVPSSFHSFLILCVSHSCRAQVVHRCHEVMTTGSELMTAARESQDLALASVLMEDFSQLTDNQVKRLTMATQVNVLKLEKQLEQEREKMGRLRKLGHEGEKYK
jgi:hypothetical protein